MFFLTEEQKDRRTKDCKMQTLVKPGNGAVAMHVVHFYKTDLMKLHTNCLRAASLNLFYYRFRAIGLMFLCTYV